MAHPAPGQPGTDAWGDGVDAALAATAARVVRGELVSQMATDGTDQTATMNAELATLYAAGGGKYRLPVGTVRIDSRITLPHNAATTWAQPPITILGLGQRQDGSWTPLNLALGGSVLDMRYTGVDSHDAKILTLGRGTLKLENITFMDGGPASSTAFLLTTNTTVKAKDCAFIGTTAGPTCTQDAILLGGATLSYGNARTDAFQGYGSTFEGLWFSRIQRGFYGRTSCNSVVFSNNTWGADCGGQTAFELDGNADIADGNTGVGNLIEMVGYLYGMTFDKSRYSAFYGTSFWDPSGITVASIRLVGYSPGNMFPGVAGTVANVESNGNDYTMTNCGTEYGGVRNSLMIVPTLATDPDIPLLSVKRSPEETVGPLSPVLEVTGAGAGRILAAPGGTGSFTVGANGTTSMVNVAALAAGAAVTIQTASSGSLAIDQTSLVRDTGDLYLYAGSTAGNVVRVVRGRFQADSGIKMAEAGATHFSGTGVPAIAGTAGDWFWRTDTPATASQRAYICTVTGAAGVATWVATAL